MYLSNRKKRFKLKHNIVMKQLFLYFFYFLVPNRNYLACIIHTKQQQNDLQVIYTKTGKYLSGLLRAIALPMT